MLEPGQSATLLGFNRPEAFDDAVHGPQSIPSGNEMAIFTKHAGMASGRAVAVLSFGVEVEGKPYRAQFSMGVRQLITTLRALEAAYTDDGMPR